VLGKHQHHHRLPGTNSVTQMQEPKRLFAKSGQHREVEDMGRAKFLVDAGHRMQRLRNNL
jgi:hypothetical protein